MPLNMIMPQFEQVLAASNSLVGVTPKLSLSGNRVLAVGVEREDMGEEVGRMKWETGDWSSSELLGLGGRLARINCSKRCIRRRMSRMSPEVILLIASIIRSTSSLLSGVECVDAELVDEGEGVSLGPETSRTGRSVVTILAAAINEGGRMAVDKWL